MKQTRVMMAVLALAALASCQTNELRDDTYTPEEGEFVFKVGRGPLATKANEEKVEIKGVSIPLEAEAAGFFLEETISEADAAIYSHATKGTPGYTENFHSLYGGFDATVFRAGETTAYEEDGRFVIANEAKLIYKRQYGNDLWDKEGLYFFLKATYGDNPMQGISNLVYHPTADGTYNAGDISFHYDESSALTAEAQRDILFTSRAITSEDEYQKLISKDEGVDILFHHALTGVKFRTGNNNTGTTKTIITRVEISGLYDDADCVISPEMEDNGYVDISNNYSSGRAVTWTGHTMKHGSFAQDYSNPAYSQTSDNTVDYTSGNANQFGNSWYTSGNDAKNPSNKNNLNDEDGTLTFWFIPQDFSKLTDAQAKNVQLKVTFVVKTPDTSGSTGAGVITHTISNFGTIMKNAKANWKAGQIRTYTLEPKDVDVEIFDTMSGLKKSGLHVTNTGNVDEYVRMMLIGNWYDKDGNIVVGYKYKDKAAATADGGDVDDMVTPWFREDPLYSPYFDEETFKDGFPCGDNPWIFGTGSYFYYPEVIGAGKVLSSTTALFQSYELPQSVIPTIWVPSLTSNERTQAQGVHLVMEVVIQAIGTTNPETGEEFADWKAAWSYVTGRNVKEKTPGGSSSSGGSDDSGDSDDSNE